MSTFQGVRNNLEENMDVGVQGGGGDGETSHKKWLDLGISLLDWYKLTASWINLLRGFQPLYLCAAFCLRRMPLCVCVVRLNVVSFWQAPRGHERIVEDLAAVEEEI